MFYLIYKITNLINGKIYIGSHKTTNINDTYMGSGTFNLKTENVGVDIKPVILYNVYNKFKKVSYVD